MQGGAHEHTGAPGSSVGSRLAGRREPVEQFVVAPDYNSNLVEDAI
jgi:hypothetical protein